MDLHAAIQFDRHHFLKMLSFVQCLFLASLSEIRCVHRHVDLCLGLQFYPIDQHFYFVVNTCCFYYL